jgi:hypothetical protein
MQQTTPSALVVEQACIVRMIIQSPAEMGVRVISVSP